MKLAEVSEQEGYRVQGVRKRTPAVSVAAASSSSTCKKIAAAPSREQAEQQEQETKRERNASRPERSSLEWLVAYASCELAVCVGSAAQRKHMTNCTPLQQGGSPVNMAPLARSTTGL